MNETIQKLPELTEWDVRLMAWHEAGHAVCSFFLPETEPIQYVSIEPDNDAFGAMQSSPRRKMNLTYISCLNEISVAMAGRLSEEMFQKEITSSCIHDLNKIQAIAWRMVCELGMGKRTGLITWLSHTEDPNEFLLFSEKQRDDIYDDIKEILDEAEKEARNLLEQHAQKVHAVVETLLSRKTLTAEILSSILGSGKNRMYDV